MTMIDKSFFYGRKPVIVKDLFRLFKKDALSRASCLEWSININSNILMNGMHKNINDFDEYESELNDLFFAGSQQYHGNPLYLPYSYYGEITSSPPITVLDSYIYTKYGDRKLLDRYFELIEKWDGDFNDLSYFRGNVYGDIENAITQNIYKWKNLLKSCMLEFNPLWNVDGTEETNRTLESGGTVENAKSGNDKIEYNGSEDLTKTGTEKMTYNGNERTTYNGTETDTENGSVTHTQSKTTTESNTWYDTEKNIDNYGGKTNQKSFSSRYDDKGYTNRNDERSFTNRKDTKSFTQRNDNTVYNSSDTETRDLSDVEQIIVERHGNIGVTTTTKLLTEFREYVTFNLLDIIANDIVKEISKGVY